MFAGALEAVAGVDTQVVYRELSGDWFQLRRSNGQLLSEPVQVRPEATDEVPVELLVRTQWEPPAHAAWSWSTPDPLPVEAMTKAGLANGWDWNHVFQSCVPTIGGKAGLLFEKYIAAILLELCVTNLAANMELRSADGQPLQEIDLVANDGGRILIIDCKLRGQADEQAEEVEGVTSQLRQAALTQRQLGGLAAETILLRPNRPFSEDERALADAYRLSIVDHLDAWELLPLLAKKLRRSRLPPALEHAQAAIVASRDQHATRVFCRETTMVRLFAKVSRSRALIETAEYMREYNQDWFAYQLDGSIFVRCGNPGRLPRDRLQREIEDRLGPYGQIEGFEASGTGSTCRFRLRAKKTRRADLVEFLESRIGKTLLS